MRSLMIILKYIHSVYKFCISPFLGDACRFEPSCSDYALAAIGKHGFLRGALMAIGRLLRCNPYSQGGLDPVP